MVAMAVRPLEIVIVDDEEQITELISAAVQISSDNVNMHIFNDPTTALDFIKNNPLDVLITDYRMPKYNGLTLIQTAAAHVKKVLISGYIPTVTGDALQQLNAVFLEKPVPIKTLSDIIHQAEAALS